jgi:hypothetical protein
MKTGIVMAAAVLVSLVAPVACADDVDAVFEQCRAALGDGVALTATIERRHSNWQITAADSVSGLERSAAMGTVEALKVWTYNVPLTAEGVRSLKKLPNLRRLDLSNIGLNEKQLAYLRPLTAVKELDLFLDVPHPVSDAVLQELMGLPNVRSLTLFDIGPEVVSALADMPHLEHLETSISKDASGQVDLSVLHGLKSLSLHSVDPEQMPLRLPSGLRRLRVETDCVVFLDLLSAKGVEAIEVDVSPPTGADPEFQSVIDGKNLKWLSRFPKLKELTVRRGERQQIQDIAKLEELRYLCFAETCSPLPPPSEEDFKALAALRKLQSLSMDAVITEPRMQVLRDLPDLRRLAGVSFDGATASKLGELKRLEGLLLYLDTNRDAARAVVAAIITLPALEDLNLQGTVTDEELAALHGLKKLRRLDLSLTRGSFSDASLASLMRSMPQLEEVKCSVSQRKRTNGAASGPSRLWVNWPNFSRPPAEYEHPHQLPEVANDVNVVRIEDFDQIAVKIGDDRFEVALAGVLPLHDWPVVEQSNPVSKLKQRILEALRSRLQSINKHDLYLTREKPENKNPLVEICGLDPLRWDPKSRAGQEGWGITNLNLWIIESGFSPIVARAGSVDHVGEPPKSWFDDALRRAKTSKAGIWQFGSFSREVEKRAAEQSDRPAVTNQPKVPRPP